MLASASLSLALRGWGVFSAPRVVPNLGAKVLPAAGGGLSLPLRAHRAVPGVPLGADRRRSAWWWIRGVRPRRTAGGTGAGRRSTRCRRGGAFPAAARARRRAGRALGCGSSAQRLAVRRGGALPAHCDQRPGWAPEHSQLLGGGLGGGCTAAAFSPLCAWRASGGGSTAQRLVV